MFILSWPWQKCPGFFCTFPASTLLAALIDAANLHLQKWIHLASYFLPHLPPGYFIYFLAERLLINRLISLGK